MEPRLLLKELLNRSIWDIFYEEDKIKVQQLVLQRKKKQVSDLHYECRLVKKNKKIIWADMASSPLQYEGENVTLVNVYNITERKKAEEKKQELSELLQRQEEQLIHSTRLSGRGYPALSLRAGLPWRWFYSRGRRIRSG